MPFLVLSYECFLHLQMDAEIWASSLLVLPSWQHFVPFSTSKSKRVGLLQAEGECLNAYYALMNNIRLKNYF